jgi:hypothetical protein
LSIRYSLLASIELHSDPQQPAGFLSHSETMRYESAIFTLLATRSVSAVPLNINLGAYSPALVVGDGAISFGSGAEAEALVNTLASTEGASNIEGLTRAGENTPTTITPAEASASASSLPSGIFGIGRSVNTLEPRKDISDAGVEKRDLGGFNAALNFATGALTTSPGVELGTGEGGSGVGITVKPGGAVGKREDASLPVAPSAED